MSVPGSSQITAVKVVGDVTAACVMFTILGMETAADCRHNADERRALADKMPRAHREQLLEMARLREDMARERAAVIGAARRLDVDADDLD